LQKAETRLLAARQIRPIAGIAQQDRASLPGLLGQRALVEFGSADDSKSWHYPPVRLQRLALAQALGLTAEETGTFYLVCRLSRRLETP